jgi:hypothetical protein
VCCVLLHTHAFVCVLTSVVIGVVARQLEQFVGSMVRWFDSLADLNKMEHNKANKKIQ